MIAGRASLGVALLVVLRRRGAPRRRSRCCRRSLLRDGSSRVAGELSLIVGFALFGTITFLPLFFQTVDDASPTAAGLRLIPLMVGLVLDVDRLRAADHLATGRYKALPDRRHRGDGRRALLLSRHGPSARARPALDAALLVLGLGSGSTMQVLVLAVQNAVPYEMLGAATSGVTLLRGDRRLVRRGRLRNDLHDAPALAARAASCTARSPRRSRGGGRLTGEQVERLPAARCARFTSNAYVNALQPVFLAAAGDGLVGFLLSCGCASARCATTAATSSGLED